MADPMEQVAGVVVGVVREALRERALRRVLVLPRPGRGGALLLGWLQAVEVEAEVAERAPVDRGALVTDPASKEVLLLEGPLPGADLLPLGDLWGSAIEAGDPGAPLSTLERALYDTFEAGEGLAALGRHLGREPALDIRRRLLRTAPLLRPPLVPKLTEWTPGIDPGP